MSPEEIKETQAKALLDKEAQQEEAKFLNRTTLVMKSIAQQPEFFTNAHRIRIMKQAMDPLLSYNTTHEVEFDHDKLIAKMNTLAGPEFMTLLRTLNEDETHLSTVFLTRKQKSQKREAGAKTEIMQTFADRVPEFISGKPAPDNFNVNATDKKGQTQLHLTAKWGAEKLIQNYLHLGADPTIGDTNQNLIPLFLATINGHEEATKKLLAVSKFDSFSSEKKNTESDSFLRCIDYLSSHNDDRLQSVFLLFLARIKQPHVLDGMLHYSAVFGCEYNFQLLLQNGARLCRLSEQLKLSEIVGKSIVIASGLLMLNIPIDNPRKFAKVILDYQMKPGYLRFFNGVPFEDRVTPNLPHLYVCLSRLDEFHCDLPEEKGTAKKDDTLLTAEQITGVRHFLRTVRTQNKAICDEVRTATDLPEDILSVIDRYNHPHGHGSLMYNKKG